FARSIGIEGVVRHAELLRERELTFQRLERASGAIELEPARLAQEALRASLCQQRFVLRERARKEGTHQPRGLEQPLRPRGGTKFHKPRRDVGQEAQMVIAL